MRRYGPAPSKWIAGGEEVLACVVCRDKAESKCLAARKAVGSPLVSASSCCNPDHRCSASRGNLLCTKGDSFPFTYISTTNTTLFTFVLPSPRLCVTFAKMFLSSNSRGAAACLMALSKSHQHSLSSPHLRVTASAIGKELHFPPPTTPLS